MATKSLVAVAAFLVWTGASFLCHQCAAMFVRTAGSSEASRVSLAVVLTFVQMLACFLITDVHLPSNPWSRQGLLGWCRVLGHVLATLTTNISMATTHAASAQAVKFAEPITSALVQRLLLSTPVSTATLLSLPLVVSGAFIFAHEATPGTDWSRGAALAFLSNICLGARNTALKLEQGQGSDLVLRSFPRVVLAVVGFLLAPLMSFVLADAIGVTSTTATPEVKEKEAIVWTTGLAVTSSLMHVLYSYTSTGVMLRFLSVVSHALASVGKRVLVVLLLYVWGKRTATGWNFLGLLVSTVGLLLYTAGKLNEKKSSPLIALHVTASGIGGSNFRRAATLGALASASLLLGSAFTQTSVWNLSKSTYSIRYPRTLIGLNISQSYFPAWSLKMKDDFFGERWNFFASERNPSDFQTLSSNPLGANVTSSKLTNAADIIQEAQRLHFTLFSGLFHPAKHAVLISMAAFENKGDPAISVGEMLLIRRLGLKLLYYCTINVNCAKAKFEAADKQLSEYANDEVVVLMQGGGNIVTYPREDEVRSAALEALSRFKFVLFPQSITLLPTSKPYLKFAENVYRNRTNLTIVLRDPQSYKLAVQHFGNKTRLLMAPDMAFQIGLTPRSMFPIYDIIWIRRGDHETSKYALPKLPKNVTIAVEDWMSWPTPKGNNTMENAVLMANNGFTFLQRGRVVITDRLHGHILSTLLDIPHVLIDNPYHKLSSYHNTWTQSLGNTILTDNPDDAVRMALYLLEKFKDTLPPILPFMDVRT